MKIQNGPIIDQPETSLLLTPSKDDLLIDLNEWGFKVLDQLLQTALDTCS